MPNASSSPVALARAGATAGRLRQPCPGSHARNWNADTSSSTTTRAFSSGGGNGNDAAAGPAAR